MTDKSVGYEQKLKYADSLINSYKNGAPLVFYKIKSDICYEMGKYKDMVQTYDTAIKYCPEDSIVKHADILFQRGLAKFTLCDVAGALEDAYQCMLESEEHSIAEINVKSHILINDILRQAQLYSVALNYVGGLSSEIDKVRSPKVKNKLQTVIYHMLASNYHDMGNMDESLRVLKKVNRGSLDSISLLSDYIINGCTARSLDQNDIAEQYFKKAVDMRLKNYNHNAALLGLYDIMLTNGKYEEVKKLMSENIELLDSLKNTVLRENVYMLEYRLAEHDGNWRKALEYYECAMEANDSIKDLVTRSDVYAKLLSLEKQSFVDQLDAEKKKGNTRLIWLWITGIILAVVIGSCIVLIIKIKKIRDEKMSLNTDVSVDADISKETSYGVIALSKRISNLTGILNKAEKILKSRSSGNEDKVSKVRELIAESEHNRDSEQSFDDSFNAAHEIFYKKLYKICPTLTTAEVKMCAYIKAGMSAKEIADVTNRSVRTVETIKYNLRKKLQIEGTTESWLARL